MTSPTSARIKRALMSDFALDNWHQHRIDRDARVIYVGGDPHIEGDDGDGRGSEPGVEHHMADRFDLNLHVLEHISKDPITVQIASCGGNWEEGMQMAGAILASPCPITCVATKHARSMTSIIPLFADKFYLRVPAPYMIHHGMAAYEGSAGASLKTWMEEMEDSRDTMLRIYVARLREQGKHSRKSPATIRVMLENLMDRKEDVFFTPDEAVEWGWADGIWTGERAKRVDKHRRRRMADVLRAPRNIHIKGVI